MEFFYWLEATSLATWINASPSVFAFPAILLTHTVGLTLLVGTTVVIDLRLLGFAAGAPIASMREFFGLFWAGLVLNVSSGLLLVIARAGSVVVNPAFWVKLAAIALALGTFFGIRRIVFRDPPPAGAPAPASARGLAIASMALWLVAITAGRMMAYVEEALMYGGF
ncbi:MAG: hypothetical protein FJW23_07435 [Acidimicrobiia bacterium]|nr:hypothetical protein [Acidimicrobiia bacterium]